MLKTAALRDRRVIVMTGLGIVSGVVGSYAYNLDDTWRELSVGLVFGLMIGAYLFVVGLATPVRAAAFALASLASWMAAERFAIWLFGVLPGDDEFFGWQGLVTGMSAGLLGAALLVIAMSALFAFFRRPGLCLATALAGGATGALFPLLGIADSGLVLFPPWQGAFALCFALGFPVGPSPRR